jgi:hypothetical protein
MSKSRTLLVSLLLEIRCTVFVSAVFFSVRLEIRCPGIDFVRGSKFSQNVEISHQGSSDHKDFMSKWRELEIRLKTKSTVSRYSQTVREMTTVFEKLTTVLNLR